MNNNGKAGCGGKSGLGVANTYCTSGTVSTWSGNLKNPPKTDQLERMSLDPAVLLPFLQMAIKLFSRKYLQY